MTFGLFLPSPGMHHPHQEVVSFLTYGSTRTITALTFIESALVHSQSLSYYFVPFIPQLLFKFRPEIWRLCTPYLLTDPKLNFVFDLYFSMPVNMRFSCCLR